MSDIRFQYGLFLAPILAVIVFNTIVLVLVARVLIKHNKKKKKKDSGNTLKTLISIVSVMVMYGLSWSFAIFSVSDAAPVFQWLFLVFNTLQGFCLFLIHCVISKDGREEWMNLLGLKKSKPKKSASSSYAPSTIKRENKQYLMTSGGTKQSSIISNEAAISASDYKVDMNSSISEDVPIRNYQPELPDIHENDGDVLICNEQVIDNPATFPFEEDAQFPPHIMLKLQSQATPIEVRTKKPRKKNKANFVKSHIDNQVPPHILDRLARPTNYEVFLDDLTFSDDGFSQNSQTCFTQLSDMYTLSDSTL
ncbi:MAG: hypothetical protein A6F71_09410 [Cycloclasticus sp. symbiont of Poecilosclerida sp. M]|nr:MAG: hypothetical protein A6F71_09410 [Cycloclasticus sp. symbiont of Poecilosclerida sp. M]